MNAKITVILSLLLVVSGCSDSHATLGVDANVVDSSISDSTLPDSRTLDSQAEDLRSAQILSVHLADDEPEQSGGREADAAGVDQSTFTLAFGEATEAGPLQIHSLRVLRENGVALDLELSVANPRKWDGEAYMPWSQNLSASEERVLFDLKGFSRYRREVVEDNQGPEGKLYILEVEIQLPEEEKRVLRSQPVRLAVAVDS